MPVTKAKNVTIQERDLVVKLVKLCFKEIVKKEHEFELYGKRVSGLMNNLFIEVKCKGQRSYGGLHRISIDISKWRKGNTYHLEYKAYSNDSVIGSREFNSPETALLGIVAHEVAHHIQFQYANQTRWLKKAGRAHGDEFKAIYHILRSRVVNCYEAENA